jgi:hypothetical protein
MISPAAVEEKKQWDFNVLYIHSETRRGSHDAGFYGKRDENVHDYVQTRRLKSFQ